MSSEMWDSLTKAEQHEFWNGMSPKEQVAFAQAMKTEPVAFAQAMKTTVAGDCVSPPSTGSSARMNTKNLGVAMVVVFCITWWLVAGEACQTSIQIGQASQQILAIEQAEEAVNQASKAARNTPQGVQLAQAREAAGYARMRASGETDSLNRFGVQVKQTQEAFNQASEAVRNTPQGVQLAQAEEALKQEQLEMAQLEHVPRGRQASINADAHFRTQASWGIGTGLLADVLLLVGALAWSKLTAKA